jgi:hypothetical protein
MVHRWDLAEVEKRWRVLAYAWDLCEIRCLCEIVLFRGCPWWLYICSQLGFTSSFCLLFQVEVLGLAGFMYPSSGLLPWQEPGRPIWVPEGAFPRHLVFLNTFVRLWWSLVFDILVNACTTIWERKLSKAHPLTSCTRKEAWIWQPRHHHGRQRQRRCYIVMTFVTDHLSICSCIQSISIS